MILINQIKLPYTHTEKELENKIRKTLKLKDREPVSYRILHRSIDGRRKPELFWVYNVGVTLPKEESLVRRLHTPSVSIYRKPVYRLPQARAFLSGTGPRRPVVVGAGPAGLFAALVLAEAGLCPIIIERGKPVEERQKDVARFWETGVLDPSSNVQFGEGGAGTFSDGKLNTSVKDPSGRNLFVLETFVRFGASTDILCDAKPHIGTDVLSKVIVNMRTYLKEKGCTFLFETAVTDFVLEDYSGGRRLSALVCKDQVIDTDFAVLAIGHSSRDTFTRLHALHVEMEPKNFAVGFRVEHPQAMINQALYGKQERLSLPAAPYKVTANFTGASGEKRGVYSFCMCPGGYVVNSSSESGGTVVNGMSYSGRNSRNANSAIIVGVTPRDFGASDPLAGIRYQKHLEEEVYRRGEGRIPQQLYGDFCQKLCSSGYGDFDSVTKGSTVFASLSGLLSPEMEEIFCMGMSHFSRIIPGFDRRDAILSGMESRTSSPVRIVRNEFLESPIRGLYPCGEGAGYAGGITSAAIDGIKVAEAIVSEVNNNWT